MATATVSTLAPAARPGSRGLLLLLICIASFAAAFSNMIVAPLIPGFSEDFHISVALAGQSVLAFALVAGVLGLFVGPALDRIGRRPLVVTGMVLLAASAALSAAAPTFLVLVLARSLAGMGAAMLIPAVTSTVADSFAYDERGRALAWIMSASTTAQIVGVPIGALVAGIVSWRWAFVMLAVFAALIALLLAWRLPPDVVRTGRQPERLRAVADALRDVPTASALGGNFVCGIAWMLFGTFMAAFYWEEFGFPRSALGAAGMAIAAGVAIGGNIGGRLSDSMGRRPLIVFGTLCAGPFLAFTVLAPNAWLSLACMVVYGTVGALRFSALQSLLTEINPAARGTVMSLFAATMQFATVIGALGGGLLLGPIGYKGIGVLGGLIYFGSVVLTRFLDESALGLRAAPEPVLSSELRVSGVEFD